MRLASEPLPPPADADRERDDNSLTERVASRVRDLRSRREWSLEQLAKASSVSRTMLWQIEQGKSAPTVKVLARISDALNVSLAALLESHERPGAYVLRRGQAKVLRESDGRIESRALFPFVGVHGVEFYEFRLQRGAVESSEAHAPGTRENLILVEGAAEVTVGETRYALEPGDALYFNADLPHEYRNTGIGPALIYLVVSHAGSVDLG